MKEEQAEKLLVWLGPPFFSPRMRDLGWTLLQTPHDILHPRSFDDVLALTGGRMPTALVVADSSTPPPVLGMERFPCLTLFYAVDAHIHSWYPFYAQGFDLCLVSLRDYLPDFAKGRLAAGQLRWSPPYALDEFRRLPGAPQKWDLTFVGTVDPARSPTRHAFLGKLRERFPALHLVTGKFVEPYSESRLVLNECSNYELNFRVFEALGCGCCLLTPDIGPAITDIFTHGKELFLYPSYDADSLLSLTRQLLDNETLRLDVARAGLAAVDAKHRASHRAEHLDTWLTELFASGEATDLIEQRLRRSRDIHQEILRFIYLHHAETLEAPELRKAYLHAAQRRKR